MTVEPGAPDALTDDAPPQPAGATGTATAIGPPARRRSRRSWIEWPVLLVTAVVAAILIRTFVLQTFWIPSGSMTDTLQRNDRVIVSKLSYDLHGIHRGDVVVFHRPANLQIPEEDLIKRVIAVDGDRVAAHDDALYLNGTRQRESYVDKDCGVNAQGYGKTDDFGPYVIPKGRIWVMGDNRCGSSDSRVFGPVRTDLVIGHALMLVWPLSRWDWL